MLQEKPVGSYTFSILGPWLDAARAPPCFERGRAAPLQRVGPGRVNAGRCRARPFKPRASPRPGPTGLAGAAAFFAGDVGPPRARKAAGSEFTAAPLALRPAAVYAGPGALFAPRWVSSWPQERACPPDGRICCAASYLPPARSGGRGPGFCVVRPSRGHGCACGPSCTHLGRWKFRPPEAGAAPIFTAEQRSTGNCACLRRCLLGRWPAAKAESGGPLRARPAALEWGSASAHSRCAPGASSPFEAGGGRPAGKPP